VATKIGVLAVQGDFSKHMEAYESAGVPPHELQEVRTVDDLAQVDRLTIPGGESSTVGLLLERYGLGPAIIERAQAGMPVWGTCMGMILMANEVEERDQYRLGLLEITVRRNAFGAQVHSFEDEVAMVGLDHPVMGVFIRAPIVTRVGEGVTVLSTYDDKIVGVRQGSCLGTSFHPELTSDTRLHEWFLTF
jgi:pyridoxal 5'-phosphate synthase pdxT subunit